MTNVRSLDAARNLSTRAKGQGLDNNHEPPDNGDMEARVAKLEAIADKTSERLTTIERDVAVIRSQMDGFAKHYATKADLTDAKNSIIMWVVGAVVFAQLVPSILKIFAK